MISPSEPCVAAAPANMHTLCIDVTTRDKNKLIHRLRGLTRVASAVDGGAYREDRNDSQVHVETSLTEDEMDAWLYTTTLDYIGVSIHKIRPYGRTTASEQK